MNDVVSVKFGIFNDFTIPFKVGSINSIFPINFRECLCSTSRNLYKIEKNEIKMTDHSVTLSASLLIPDTDLLVGVAMRTNRLFVYQTTNLSQPIISNYPTNHFGIHNIYYSPRSSSLILVGYGIKVFHFNIKHQGNRHSIFPPDITIKFRSKFCDDYSPSFFIPLPFDADHEYVYLPTKEGICPYDLDGNKKSSISKFPASMATVYFYNEHSRKVFTFEPNQGLIQWTQSGQIEQRFPSAGTSIISMFLVDKENIVCLASAKKIFLLNFVTGRTFFCHELERKPSRLFLIKSFNKPYLMICQGATLIALRIEIPWKVWSHPLRNCSRMIRCNKMNEAGRVYVQTKDNIIDLFSPSKGKLISSATQKKAVNPASFFYDRGFFQFSKKSYSKYELFNVKIDPHENTFFPEKSQENSYLNDNHRDILFFVFDDGTISGFFTGVSPCTEVLNLNLKANFLCVVHYENNWCYAALSKKGILSLFDYLTFDLISQANIGYLEVINFFYDALNKSLIIVNTKKTLIFDLQKKQIKDEIEITGSEVVDFFGDFIKFGYKSGHITTVYIENGKFNVHSMRDNRSHSSEITGFSFSPKIWISSSIDCNVLAWNYHEETLFQITFPLPLTSCCITNGYRDILVSTDSEIMKVEGKDFFIKFDTEIPEIDNFDKLTDYIDLPHFFAVNDMIRKAKSKLASSLKAKSTVSDSILVEKSAANSVINDSPSKNEKFDFSTPKKSPPKVHSNAESEKIIQSMMEMNGLKSPIVPQFKINNNNVKNQQQQQTKNKSKNEEEKSNKKQSVEVKSISPKTPKKAVSAKDFLKNEMEKEMKSKAKPKKAKKKKNNLNKKETQKVETEESKPTKSAFDLLSQMDQGSSNKNNKHMTKMNTPKKTSTIDFSALAKQFQKVEDDKENEYQSESETDTESDDEKKKRKKKKKSEKVKKEKKKSQDESDSLSDENTQKAQKVKAKTSPVKKQKRRRNTSKVKSNSADLFQSAEQTSTSHEASLLQSKGIQSNSNSNSNENENENEQSSHKEEEQPSYSYSEDGEEQSEEAEFRDRATENEEIESLHNDEDEEEEEAASYKNESNGETADVFKEEESEAAAIESAEHTEEEEEAAASIESAEQEKEEEEEANAQDEGVSEKMQALEATQTDDSASNLSDAPLDQPPPQKKFTADNKPSNASRTPRKFTFQLKRLPPVKETRRRASTPDPDYRSSARTLAKAPRTSQIRRCFSFRPRCVLEPPFEFDAANLDEIPANIWIDEEALFAKYAIRRRKDEENGGSRRIGVVLEERPNSNSNEKVVKFPQKPNSNFFRRKNVSSKSLNQPENDHEGEIDDTVRRLSFNQYQLHQIQRSFQHNLTYDEYDDHENDRNRPNNRKQTANYTEKMKFNEDRDISKNFERDEFFQYFTHQSNSQKLNEKNNSNEIKDDNFRIPKQSSMEINELQMDNSNGNANENSDHDFSEIEIINEPPAQKVPKSPRKLSKKEGRSCIRVCRNFVCNDNNTNKKQIDQLEEAFMKKMPNFEMKKKGNCSNNSNKNRKRPSSSRKISKPKLYLNPVYPPNRNRGIDGAVVKSSFSTITYL